jgi:hypothetical protein
MLRCKCSNAATGFQTSDSGAAVTAMLLQHKQAHPPAVGCSAAHACCRAMRALQNVYFQEAERLAKVGVSACGLTTASYCSNLWLWPLAGWCDAAAWWCAGKLSTSLSLPLPVFGASHASVMHAGDCSKS